MGGSGRARWNLYSQVANIDGAVERVVAGGGSTEIGPYDGPGVELIVIGVDPQGAAIALVGKIGVKLG